MGSSSRRAGAEMWARGLMERGERRCRDPAFAALVCKTVHGQLVIAIDPPCQIVMHGETPIRVLDATFLATRGVPATCSRGLVSGAIADEAVTGEVLSGSIE